MNTPLLEETRGLCPTCLRDVPAQVREERGQIYLESTCPRHGPARARIGADADEYRRLRQYTPARVGGCCCGPGDSCGPDDGPPTCVLLLEITQACNLRCPTCYADAQGHDFMTLDEGRHRLEAFFRTQPTLDVLMLSGGEPTIHPRFADFLEMALAFPVGRVLVNTNGLRLAQSAALMETLARHRDRIELYFSFSGLRPEIQTHFYGRDLIAEKTAALRAAHDAGLFTNLVMAVEAGVNDSEIGGIVRFVLEQPGINGLVFQPVMDTGRYRHAYDAADRMTLTGVLQELEAQTEGMLRSQDFIGLPCSHPDCCALTYAFLNADRTGLTPLPRHLDIARYLELFSDRISFSGLLGAAARRVWSDLAHLRAGRTLADLAALFRQAGVRDALPLLGQPERFGRRVFRVIVKPFMDAQTYDRRRIEQCCTKIVNAQGQAVSFCEYNIFHRGRAAKAGTVPLTMANEGRR